MVAEMEIIETPVFTEQITKLLTAEDYRAFQVALALNPESGDLIRNSRGLRKIRWRRSGSGKSGGIRVIYYLVHREEVFLLCAYTKAKQENLSLEQVKILAGLVKQYLEET